MSVSGSSEYSVSDHLSLSETSSEEEPFQANREPYTKIRDRGSVVDGQVVDSISDLYEMEEQIGSGAFAEVWRGKEKASGRTVALKLLPKSQYKPGSRLRTMVQREVQLLQELDHKNVVGLYDVLETATHVILSMEYCYGGMLFDKVAELDTGGFDENLARDILRTLTAAVAALHAKGIAHRDLKLENLLLATETVSADGLRIADFGFARRFGVAEGLGGEMATYCGTPGYMAPEIFEIAETGGSYTDRSDVWSIGCIAHALLTGYLPFDADYASEIEAMSRFVPLTFPKDIWRGTSKRSRRFVKACLAKNPMDRPTSAELLKTRWLREKAESKLRPLNTPARLSIDPSAWKTRSTSEKLTPQQIQQKAKDKAKGKKK